MSSNLRRLLLLCLGLFSGIVLMLSVLVVGSRSGYVEPTVVPGYWAIFDGISEPRCSDTGFSFRSSERYSTPPAASAISTRLITGLNQGFQADTGLKPSALYPANRRGWVTDDIAQQGFTIPPQTEYTIIVVRYLFVDGQQKSLSVLTAQCSAGPNRVLSYVYVSSAGESVPVAYQGVDIPARKRFSMYSLTCDTRIYDAPRGNPLMVGNNRLITGQRWFFNPTFYPDNTGALWAETLVAGYPNGFIPASSLVEDRSP